MMTEADAVALAARQRAYLEARGAINITLAPAFMEGQWVVTGTYEVDIDDPYFGPDLGR